MDLAHPSTLIIPAAVAALVAWRLASRVRRLVSRQRLSRVRPWINVVVFPAVIALIAFGAIAQGTLPIGLAAGVVVGALLGRYGLRLTRFETTPEGLYYTPNAYLGLALSLLLIGRLGYRAVQLVLAKGAADQAAMNAAMMQSPLTLALFGTLAGYYVSYAVGLLLWRRRAVASGAGAVAA